MKAYEKELDIIRNKGDAIERYSKGMNDLFASGVFSFLRSIGRVWLSPKDSTETVAINGAYAAGFQDALDFLINFKEQFYDIKTAPSNLTADFGAKNTLLQRGDFTKDELDGKLKR